MEPENNSILNGYQLSRQWHDFAFENPEKINPNHGALYFFMIEHCNRLGWKRKFGLPSSMAKDAIGIRSYNTYIKTLNDLIDWGFVEMIEKSKNQYSANIIALSKIDKAPDKALDKAISLPYQNLTKHSESTYQSTCESICSINKLETNKPNNKEGKEIPQPTKKKKDLILPYNSDRFCELWEKLIATPKWKKKTIDQLSVTLEKLEKYDEQFSINLLEAAISGNWQGLIFTDTDEKFQKFKTKHPNQGWNRGQILNPDKERKREIISKFENQK